MAQQPTAAPAAPKIKIDGVEYDVSKLSKNARGLIATIRMADREMRRLEAQLALMRISRQTLSNGLKSELANPKPEAAAANTVPH
jgi:hypothetical protein